MEINSTKTLSYPSIPKHPNKNKKKISQSTESQPNPYLYRKEENDDVGGSVGEERTRLPSLNPHTEMVLVLVLVLVMAAHQRPFF